MDGVIVIDKEKDMTSHDVVAKLRHTFGTKKIGHTGTLDPIATGVLVVCVGQGTKLVQYLTCDDKIYDVEMKFGEKTDTGDRTGKVIETGKNRVNKSRLTWTMNSILGKQKQLPPMYSAIKVNGKKLYEYAREGKYVHREPRDIEVFSVENVEYDGGDTLKFRIHCSKGTYIRTICETIAYRCNTVGTMTELRRVKAGMFSIDQAVKLEDASDAGIITMDKLFDQEVSIKKDAFFKISNGMPLYFNKPDGLYKIYIDNYVTKKFVGIGKLKERFLYREIIL